jgi:hypothetical protein
MSVKHVEYVGGRPLTERERDNLLEAAVEASLLGDDLGTLHLVENPDFEDMGIGPVFWTDEEADGELKATYDFEVHRIR